MLLIAALVALIAFHAHVMTNAFAMHSVGSDNVENRNEIIKKFNSPSEFIPSTWQTEPVTNGIRAYSTYREKPIELKRYSWIGMTADNDTTAEAWKHTSSQDIYNDVFIEGNETNLKDLDIYKTKPIPKPPPKKPKTDIVPYLILFGVVLLLVFVRFRYL